MRVTKNKLKDEYGALSSGMQTNNANTNGGANVTPVKAKATPKKRKTKGAEDDEESPTKKTKKGGAKGSESPVKKEQVEGEQADDIFG